MQGLRHRAKEEIARKSYASDAAKLLLSELDERFGHYFDCKRSDFDPHFVLCSLLDPSQAYFLVDFDDKFLSNLLTTILQGNADADIKVEEHDLVLEDTKRNSFEKMMEQKASEREMTSANSKFKIASAYVESAITKRGEPAEIYWNSNGKIEHVSKCLLLLNL